MTHRALHNARLQTAAEALGALTNFGAVMEIVQADVIPPLVAMLTLGCKDEKASQGGPPVAEDGAIPRLVALMASRRQARVGRRCPVCPALASPRPSRCLQKAAAKALGALADKAAEAIVQAGGIPPLVAMMTSGGEDEKASHGWATESLCASPLAHRAWHAACRYLRDEPWPNWRARSPRRL